jgi:DNA-binding winged helix-turn-helix (wHTH) protein/RNA polymerase-binding transcription factor DksA
VLPDVTFGGFLFSRSHGKLWHNGLPVALKPKEIQLLALLAERSPSVVQRDEIIERLWAATGSDAALNQTVYRLRQTLARYEPTDVIRTLPDLGFQLSGGTPLDARNEKPDALRPGFAKYQQAARRFKSGSVEGMLQAISMLEEVSSTDPEFEAALLLLARAYTTAGIRLFYAPSQAYWRARVALEASIGRNPSNSDAFATLSTLLLFFNADHKGAGDAAERALLLAPYSPVARYAAVWERLARRDFSAALTQADLSLTLSPSSHYGTALLGMALYMSGRLAEAIDAFESALSLDSEHSIALFYLACARALTGEFSSALRALDRITTADMATRTIAARGFIAARCGDDARAEAAIERLKAMDIPSDVSLAAVYIAQGNLVAASAALDRAIETREPGLFLTAIDPMYAPVWQDENLVERLNAGRPLQCDFCGERISSRRGNVIWQRTLCWNCSEAHRTRVS